VPTEIRIFYTSTCPYSRRIVGAAHKFAMMNPAMRTDAIDVLEFHDLANEAKMNAVSRVSINNEHEFEGVFAQEAFASYVLSR